MTYSLSIKHSLLSALGSDLGIVVSQLHYWLSHPDEWGQVVNGRRYVYNSLEQWQEQFNWFSRSKIYRLFKELRDRGIVLFEQFEKSDRNHIGYYSLNYDKLAELNIDFSNKKEERPKRSETSTFHQRNIDIPMVKHLYIDPKNTFKEIQAKHECLLEKEIEREGEKEQEEEKQEILATETPINSSSVNQESISKRKATSRQVDEKINNLQWQSHLNRLDELGVKLNRNLERMVKEYATDEVEAAIAICIERRKQTAIVNLEGYFVQALKEGWGKQQTLSCDEASTAVFAYWYGLMREMGNVSGQEVREGEQWVNANGYWERFEDMWERGYTLDFVRKRYQRSKNDS